MLILRIIVGAFCGMGVLFILLDALRIPYMKTSRAVGTLAKKQRSKESSLNVLLSTIADWLSKYVYMSDYNRARLKIDLASAQIDMTPERYHADAIVYGALIGVFAIPALFLSWMISVGILLIAYFMYYQKKHEVTKRLRAKREQIEYELASFVFTIEKTLRHSRDVLSMIESHAEMAGPEFKQELLITAADMRSGNASDAIARMEKRVGSTLFSDVCRGLQAILTGSETAAYWTAIETKLVEFQRNLLKRKAQSIPRKVRVLSMILLFCFIATFSVIIIYQIIANLSGIF